MKKLIPFSDQLRAAVETAGQSRYRISMGTGIPQGNLCNFVHGKNGLTMANVDILCNYLQLQLVAPKKKKVR